jgi:hypothetical protein
VLIMSDDSGVGSGKAEVRQDRDEPHRVPEPPGSVAWRLFVLLVRHSAGVTELVEDLLGRPVRSRLLGGAELPRIAPPGLTRLATTGPVLRRHVLLADSLPPHLPVAVTWSVVVPDRLPAEVTAALRDGAEPLDRVLTDRGLPWTARVLETEALPARDASTAFGWTAPGALLVERTSLLRLAGAPIATTIDELPFLPPRDPGTPLLPVPG